jgi:hypothetical protein
MPVTTRVRILAVATGAMLLIATAAQAQRIHRWVDDKGVVHYTDHPPPDSTRAEIIADIPKSNRPPPPPVTASVPTHESRAGSGSEKDKSAADRQGGANRKQIEETYKKAADQRLVDSCKARRDTFCGGGADVIRKKEAEKAWHQYDLEMSGRNRANAPRTYGAPPKPPTVDRPSTSSTKKK